MLNNSQISQSSQSALNLAIKENKLSHSIILHGSNEMQRLSTAKTLAMAMVCLSDNKPCQECLPCKKIIGNIHPDVNIINGYDETSMIKVDAIRQLKSKALVYPNDGDKSVFIIHGAEKMNVQAQNALLKIFEEPAKHVCFILTCESTAALISTINSRATVYFLGNENKETSHGDSNESALAIAVDLVDCLCSNNELAFIKKTSQLHKDKALFKEVVGELPLVFRDAIIVKNSSSLLLGTNEKLAQKLATTFTMKQLVEFMQQSQDFIALFDTVPNHNLFIARLSSRFYSIKAG